MHYLSPDLGFSFDLPQGWRHDERNLTLTFYGPTGGMGLAKELIQVQIGGILPKYLDLSARERFLAEPGAEISRGKLGPETNVVIMTKPSHSEMSAVHDGIQYSIAYAIDSVTLEAINTLTGSFTFPPKEKAIDAIKRWNDPRKQAILKALKAETAKEARKTLEEAGVPVAGTGTGQVAHSSESRTTNNSVREESVRKWWQFWKP